MEYQPGVGLDARSAKHSGPLLHSRAFCVDKMAEQLRKCKGHSLGSLGEQILAGFTLLFLRGRLALQMSVVLAVYWRRICPGHWRREERDWFLRWSVPALETALGLCSAL